MMRPSDERGVVLLLVLVILVASISTVYAFTRTTTLEVLSSRQRAERTHSRSSGATTARAALFFYELNNEISTATDMRYNLDKLVQALVTSNDDLSLNQLDLVTRSILARPSTTLSAWETVICGGPCQ